MDLFYFIGQTLCTKEISTLTIRSFATRDSEVTRSDVGIARRACSIAMEGALARSVRMHIVVAVGLALIAFATQPKLDDLFLQLQPSCHRDAPLYQKRCAVTWINLIYVSVAKVEDSWYIGLTFHWLHTSQWLNTRRLQRFASGLPFRALNFASSPLVALAEAVLFIMGVPSIITFTLIDLFTNLITWCFAFAGMTVRAFHHFLLGVLLVPWNTLSGLFVRTANEASNLFSGLHKLLYYGLLISSGLAIVKFCWNDYSAVSQIKALMEPLALNEVENELEIAGRYLMNPNSRLRDIAFIKRDLVRVLSELDAILTDGLPDARESKREYSRQINRILERIQALGH